MPKYRIVLDPQPEEFNALMINADGEVKDLLLGLEVVNVAGMAMVCINEWLVSRDRIVAVIPETAKERRQVRVG